MCRLPMIAGLFLALIVLLVESRHSPAQDSISQVQTGELKTLDGHFPLKVPATKQEWETRAAELRQHLLISTGLWPEPERTPLNAVIHGRIEREGFSIEKVYFESLPGHYVTGLLFRPLGNDVQGNRPGVLCPHGHGGRMDRFNEKRIQEEIAAGREKYVESGQMPKLARCAQLARMGCVTFIFDMLGYADSVQFSFEVAHRHQNPRPEETRPSDGSLPSTWTMYSIDAEMRLQSIMGLQLWNASRALDFLASLPDVDDDRLAVTGNSGGGTQTIMLGAIDPRVKVSFPNGMVSTSMQGGCYCENCNLLRVDTGNVELAALMAPRPQAMTAVNDWTREMITDGYPQLKQIYRLVGDEADVRCDHFPEFPHSFNYVTRALMYSWMNRHLALGLPEPIIETDFAHITDEEGKVWNEAHPQPTTVGPEHEREVCKWFNAQANLAIDELWPSTSDEIATFQSSMRTAWKTILSVSDSAKFHASPMKIDRSRAGENVTGASAVHGHLERVFENGLIPLTIIQREGQSTSGPVVVWCLDGGRDRALAAGGDESRLLKMLLDSGATVMLPDLYGQGEYERLGDWSKQRLINDKRHYAAFTFGYNRTLDAQRTADLLQVITHAKNRSADPVALIGSGTVAPVALAATAIAEHQVARAAVMLDGFRFTDVTSYTDVHFVPGAVKYGDIDALVALAAPTPMLISDSRRIGGRARTVYQMLEASDSLFSHDAKEPLAAEKLAEFVTSP